jgi:hypothetical protein
MGQAPDYQEAHAMAVSVVELSLQSLVPLHSTTLDTTYHNWDLFRLIAAAFQ